MHKLPPALSPTKQTHSAVEPVKQDQHLESPEAWLAWIACHVHTYFYAHTPKGKNTFKMVLSLFIGFVTGYLALWRLNKS